MSDPTLTEKQLEDDIEAHLLEQGGYLKGDPRQFDRTLALDTETLLHFIKTTQPKQWEKYITIYGSDSETKLIQRITREIDRAGLLKVLRTEINDRGCRFRLIYWKPETTINTETRTLYDQNILHCTRQLHYSPHNENSIDVVLFVNGIPIISIELKNQFTGQNVGNAIQQYRFDRNGRDPIFQFKKRILAHFAVDLYEVWMTTRLNGPSTHFLPFNQGSEGPGNTGGKGNPSVSGQTYTTAYLWKQILTKDSLLEILHKYLHLKTETDSKNKNLPKKETLIFPRYHQLDCVTKLLADVRANCSGKNYLIQHSAGSGKSNSIAWLAHRLMSLHDQTNAKIFQSVIVVTDRKVLDSQLQDTIYQFDHVDGVVQKIDKNSQQLKDAVNNAVPIIITTLQKFPVIYQEIISRNKNFAIIVDEAHSSQTGEAARKLKIALATTGNSLEAYEKIESAEEQHRLDPEDRLNAELAAHGQHKNLSFFAFTATPKDKTLQMFGTRQQDGTFKPFHIYSMRQAIEEGFILDVLKNYTTYTMYYRIIKNISDDPELDSTAGLRAIKKYESLHSYNLAQKTAVMIEHFRSQTKNQIGGNAKAMVVTASRLHAVRYYFEFQRYLKEKGYTDARVLVAFSGEITDNEETWTEEKLNKTLEGEPVRESQLPKIFHDEANILIVAEKYQTGFDEPFLHTMFVDKKLTGIKAVQTLSRLNRTIEGKDTTFVLDFVNTAEEMQTSFQPYYEATILSEETDPNILYTIKSDLDEFRIYTVSEVDAFANIFFHSNSKKEDELLGKLSSLLKPALDRYSVKPEEDRVLFKAALARFIRIYSFITQIYRMYDGNLERFYRFAKFLQKILPKGSGTAIDLSDKVLLEYYRLEHTYTGSVVMEPSGEYALDPIKGFTGKKEEKKDTLTQIIEKVNDQFGTDFTNQDKVLHQIKDTLLDTPGMGDFAKRNTEKVFSSFFNKKFEDVVVAQYEKNETFFIQLLQDEQFMKFVCDLMRREVYQELRKPQASA